MKKRGDGEVLLIKAREDLSALTGMRDPQVFTDAIFGFHAQQAIEKALKAWIDILGHEYPLTHDLRSLLKILSDLGMGIDRFKPLLRFNLYGVLFRYVEQDSHLPSMNRDATVKRVTRLVEMITKRLDEAMKK